VDKISGGNQSGVGMVGRQIEKNNSFVWKKKEEKLEGGTVRRNQERGEGEAVEAVRL
jgi:hypothetical protein